jgi:hypothetical protein
MAERPHSGRAADLMRTAGRSLGPYPKLRFPMHLDVRWVIEFSLWWRSLQVAATWSAPTGRARFKAVWPVPWKHGSR